MLSYIHHDILHLPMSFVLLQCQTALQGVSIIGIKRDVFQADADEEQTTNFPLKK